MRLGILDNGHRKRARLFMWLTGRLSGVEMADVPKVLLYRPEFFGRSMLELSAARMRGPSYWTAGEREYLAMVTAGWHQCPYCVETHAELTRIAAAGEIDPADPASARPELRAVLAFLEKATQQPDTLAPRDVEAVRDAGVPDDAIVQVLEVDLIWNTINRLANAFGFTLRPGQLHTGTRSLHRFGYRFPSFLTGTTRSHRRSGDDGLLVANLRLDVLDAPAHTDLATRRAAATGEPLPEPWRTYTAKVRDQSYRVTDIDIGALKSAGHTEDEIFEITVAAAVGAALRSLDAGQHALRPDT